MVKQNFIESFEAGDKQKVVTNRVRGAIRQGMVELLNVGLKPGHKLYYPLHQMTVTVPDAGSTFQVPSEVAQYFMKMFPRHLQAVHSGQLPSNFTPPPGYRLVPVEDEINEEDLLKNDPEE